TLNRIRSVRKPESALGSTWNSFVFGGCTQETLLINSSFEDEQQSVDWTPFYRDLNIGSDPDTRFNYLTTQFISVHDNFFTGAADGFTTHPGTYDLLVTGNSFKCETGIRMRSKGAKIIGNSFKCYSSGISLSAFYEDTQILNNDFEDVPVAGAAWFGVLVSPTTSEIMNNNNIRNVVISGNTFRCKNTNSWNTTAGIRFAHSVPTNPGF